MTRTRNARHANAARPFGQAVFDSCMQKMWVAYRKGKFDHGDKNLMIDFFAFHVLGRRARVDKRGEIDTNKILVALGHKKYHHLARIFCRSLIEQSRARERRLQFARLHSLPLPPPKTSLPGEDAWWYKQTIAMVSRTTLSRMNTG